MRCEHGDVAARSRYRILGMVLAFAAALAAKPAAADYLAYSGTTAGGPTWNRPDENGLLPPTSLSPVGTNVAYSARTFTVTTSGTYDLASVGTSPAGWDNYTFLYQGSFNPASPLTNVVIGNDDDNANITPGVSGFLGVDLTAGQQYTFVTTGFLNADAGAFENSIAQQSVFQTGTTAGGPTWDPFQDGEAIPYRILAFTVSISGRYSFQSVGNYDNLTGLYQNSFNPNAPDDNLLNVSGPNPIFGLSGFLGQELSAGVTYYFVTSGLDEASFGTFTNTYSGPGTLSIVPEPAAILSLFIGVSAVCGLSAARRLRRRAR